MTQQPPVALTIAGFDTCSGAGLQADLLTFHNHGYHGLTAATSLVVETPLQVRHCEPVSSELLHQQVELLLATYQIAVIKIGLIASPDQAQILSKLLAEQAIPIVLDPVGISSTGNSLQKNGTSEALMRHLAPLATLLTPNLPEARFFLKNSQELTPNQVAYQLSDQTGSNVLLTGGHHGEDLEICDLLVENGQETSFCAPQIETPASLHGTGCVLSSAIAAHLGKNQNLSTAIAHARRYLREAMTHHYAFPHSEPLLALNHHPVGRHDQ